MRIIAGLETISEGDVIIGDKAVNDVKPSKRGIAMVFQSGDRFAAAFDPSKLLFFDRQGRRIR